MHLTVCVVTSRPDWLDWLVWNIKKQTRQPNALMVVCHSPASPSGAVRMHQRFAEAFPELVVSLEDVLALTEHSVAATIGQLRNTALGMAWRYAAHTNVIGWFDDDDWHHPERLEVLMREMEKPDVDVAFVGNQYRLMLEDLELILLDEARDAPEISLPFGLFDASLALSAVFPEKNIGEDRAWMDQVIEASGEPPKYMDYWDIPTMCIIHGENTWNRRDLPEYEMYREFPWCAQPLPVQTPAGIDDAEWTETHRRLKVMQEVGRKRGK